MCGHEFMFHARDHLQRHRPRWQCGTCGRVSSVPIDCCTRSDLARPHLAELTRLLSQWISGCGRWSLASVRLLWGWQRHPAIRVGTTPATARPHNMVTGGVMMPTADGDESPEADDVVVAAGERR